MDANRFDKRLKRYASLSSKATSFAFQNVIQTLFGRGDEANQAMKLAASMGELKGPVMKIAQFLSTVPDAVPSSYAQAFETLQSQAPAMGWSFVRRRMMAELGPQWQDYFRSFSKEPQAAASLGQVHKGVLTDGQTVACKLQYPDMASIVDADMQELSIALTLFEKIAPAIRFDAIKKEIAGRLREELNYHLEAQHIRWFQKIFQSCEWIHVPGVHASLSTQRLLTMDWLEGQGLSSMKSHPQEARNDMAKRLFHAWYHPFYHYGLIHGDPHLGNYTFRDDHHINLLDFGCVRRFSPTFVQGVLDLFHALRLNQPKRAAEAYEAWGFQGLTNEKIEILNLWAHMLYEPLMDDRVRPIQEGNRGIKGRQTAEKVFESLKKLGGVHPPQEFVFMDRAAVGIGSAFMHLGAELNWHLLFMDLMENVTPDFVAKNQEIIFNTSP